MDKEMNSHKERGTWDIVPSPKTPPRNIVDGQWHYIYKFDEDGKIIAHKCQYVAKGYSQIYGVDFTETNTPMTRLQTIQLLLAYAAFHGYIMVQLDIKTTYLNGKLEDEIYMKQPDSYVLKGKEDWLCLIRCGLYGLQQNAATWYKTLKATLLEPRFTLSHYDLTLFFKLCDNK